MHIDIPRAQLLIEERDTMETVGKLGARVCCREPHQIVYSKAKQFINLSISC